MKAIRHKKLSESKRAIVKFDKSIRLLTERDVSPCAHSDSEFEKENKGRANAKHMQRKRKLQDKMCSNWRQIAYDKGYLVTRDTV